MVRVRDALFSSGGEFARDADKIPERVLYDYAGWLFRVYDADRTTSAVEHYDRTKRKWVEIDRFPSRDGVGRQVREAALRVWPNAEGLLPDRIGGVHYGVGMLYPAKKSR